ncbi:hypothetical protein [Nocardia sp. NPDC049707]|uniref:hypothetical protein n=1 Tax=Nocardia sp. NPDC049707 TaxID=3154735 RepID=UPI0034152BAD
MVRLIDGLEAAGFVIRTRDTTDRRKYRLSITQPDAPSAARPMNSSSRPPNGCYTDSTTRSGAPCIAWR